jgi:hypothetical protein
MIFLRRVSRETAMVHFLLAVVLMVSAAVTAGRLRRQRRQRMSGGRRGAPAGSIFIA